jgi:hypothetical protein
MFGKKKLYKIKYRFLNIYETVVSARSPYQAIKKLNKQYYNNINMLSIEEI